MWALGIGLTVYAGSMQFVLVSLLSSGASLWAAATMTIVISSRHMFYGLSFLSRFPAMGALTRQLLPVGFTGIDFSMAALFVVLFVEQYKAQTHPLPALLGAVLCARLPVCVRGEPFHRPSAVPVAAQHAAVHQRGDSRPYAPAPPILTMCGHEKSSALALLFVFLTFAGSALGIPACAPPSGAQR